MSINMLECESQGMSEAWAACLSPKSRCQQVESSGRKGKNSELDELDVSEESGIPHVSEESFSPQTTTCSDAALSSPTRVTTIGSVWCAQAIWESSRPWRELPLQRCISEIAEENGGDDDYSDNDTESALSTDDTTFDHSYSSPIAVSRMLEPDVPESLHDERLHMFLDEHRCRENNKFVLKRKAVVIDRKSTTNSERSMTNSERSQGKHKQNQKRRHQLVWKRRDRSQFFIVIVVVLTSIMILLLVNDGKDMKKIVEVNSFNETDFRTIQSDAAGSSQTRSLKAPRSLVQNQTWRSGKFDNRKCRWGALCKIRRRKIKQIRQQLSTKSTNLTAERLKSIACTVGASTLATFGSKIGLGIDKHIQIIPAALAARSKLLTILVPSFATIGTAIGASIGTALGLKVADIILLKYQAKVSAMREER